MPPRSVFQVLLLWYMNCKVVFAVAVGSAAVASAAVASPAVASAVVASAVIASAAVASAAVVSAAVATLDYAFPSLVHAIICPISAPLSYNFTVVMMPATALMVIDALRTSGH